MKVLYVTTISLTVNSFFKPHIEMLVQEDAQVDIACNSKDLALDTLYSNIGCVHYQIDFSRSPFSKSNITAYRQLKKVITDGNYDIIHCHTPVGAMIARLAGRSARRKGTKVIYTAHGFHFYKGAPLQNWLLYYPVERFLARFTDVLITINKEDYRRAQSFKAGKVVYVPGVGIDTAKFSESISKDERRKLRAEMGVPDDAVLLCSVGELNQNKNHSLIIRALSEFENKNIHYCIAGQGALREHLITLSKELCVSDRVHLLGYCTDVHSVYKSSDIFCFPSFREGLPVSLMEAMASGLPCVASRIRGSMDLLESESDMLFDPNSAEECKTKLEQLISDNATVKRKDYSSVLLPFTRDMVITEMKKIYGINW